MASLDKLIEAMDSKPVKVFIPKVGHRIVTKQNGRITDQGGNDFTNQFNNPVSEKETRLSDRPFYEDHPHVENIGENIQESHNRIVRDINLGIHNSNNTIKSLQELKQILLNDSDLDENTMQTLDQIEEYISNIRSKYINKKEDLRRTI